MAKKKLMLSQFHNASGDEIKAPVEPTMKAVVISETSQEPNTAETVVKSLQNGENLAAPTKQKGVNWVLIGGIAIGSILLFKYLKRK